MKIFFPWISSRWACMLGMSSSVPFFACQYFSVDSVAFLKGQTRSQVISLRVTPWNINIISSCSLVHCRVRKSRIPSSVIWPISFCTRPTFPICLQTQSGRRRMTGSDGEPVEFYPKFSDLLPGLCLLRRPPKLSVIDATHPAVCSYIARAVQMSGFWLSSQTVPTLSLAIQTPGRPGSWAHTE